MTDEQREELAAAYRLELARVRRVHDKALSSALGELGSLRAGQELAARSLAARLLEQVAELAEQGVDGLIDAHFRSGDREPQPIADRIQGEYLSAALPASLGQPLFKGRGVQAGAARLAASHAAACHARLTSISATVRDRALVRRSRFLSVRHGSAAVPVTWPASYQLLEELGVGGFARVYSARAPDGHVVAVKVADANEDALKRALREIDALQELQHQNIMSLLDHADDGAWFVMPKAEAKLDVVADLARIEGPKLEELVRAIGSALEHAHSKGLVHRDLSPGNILRVDDRWVVSDWGLAKLPPGFRHSAMTKSGLGTAPWAAPEVLSDASKADLRADLFSLGRIIGWLVTADTPEVNRPSVMPPHSPWYDFVRAATQFRPGDRPADIAELTKLLPAGSEGPPQKPAGLPSREMAHLGWNVHMKDGTAAAFSVSYAARGNEIERRSLEASIPMIPRKELSEILGRAADQIAEQVVALMPAPHTARTEGRVLMPIETSEHATRVVMAETGDAVEPSIRWTREEHYPGGGYQAPSALLPLSEFVPEVLECVAVLDAEAVSIATQAINGARERNWSKT